jgi:hypothetical protein
MSSGFMIGLPELVIILLIIVGIFVVTSRGRKSTGDGTATPLAARGMTLNCPHCGTATDATQPQCSDCGKEL